jgi:twitching motility protein PilT
MREADFAINVPGIGRFRVNVYQQKGTVAFAMRSVMHAAATICELNLPPVLEQIAMKPRGLVLVTGVTGSGKSTALAAMIQVINERVRRTSSRSKIRSSSCIATAEPHQPARNRHGYRDIRAGVAARAPAGPRRHHDRRNSRSGDARRGAQGRRHGTPGLFHAAHDRCDVDHQPHPVVLSAAPAERGAICARQRLSAVISLRLVPRADEPGRVPACEVLVNTEAVRDQIRDLSSTLNIPDLIKEGSVAYGMQSFDQSLMKWFSRGIISYESAQFYATNPAELALRVQGVDGSSDATWDGFRGPQTGSGPR